ncbi:MAG: DUF2231 domain-containing protein [Microthrixaceae bacterium]|nr:DUF2231 domain-containing protein [Microthrixaceae bacterium]
MGSTNEWAHDFWRAGTYVIIGGFIVSVPAALTGLADRNGSSQAGTQARRTINTHALVMVIATVLAVIDIVWRLSVHDTEASAPVGIMVLSVLTAATTALGATFGGSLVFEHGFNVENAGDDPVWHESETDVFPGGTDPHPRALTSGELNGVTHLYGGPRPSVRWVGWRWGWSWGSGGFGDAEAHLGALQGGSGLGIVRVGP